MKRFLSLVCLTALGCASHKAAPTADAGAETKSNPMALFAAPEAKPDRPQDPKHEPRLLVQLTVYKLTVPARTVSHGDEFWKHVDEASIDVGQHDLLFANGFRVGVAPRGDWDYFRKILERDTVVSQVSGAAGIGGRSLEMPFKQGVDEDTVMYIHPEKGLVGQRYERCDEAMSIRFEPVPRKSGDVRVALVPVFRSTRTELIYTARNESQPYTFVHPDYKFDLKLQVDVPFDNFLIVAPSADADRSASLGRKLLHTEIEGQEYETVLLLAPQPFQFDKPVTPATTQTADATTGK